MVWRAGKPSIKIRKAAILVFSKALNRGILESDALHKLYPEILPPLKTCMDDDWAPDLRLSATHFMTLLITALKDHLDQIELSQLYPVLLSRLEDAQDGIRIEITEAIKRFFGCKHVGCWLTLDAHE